MDTVIQHIEETLGCLSRCKGTLRKDTDIVQLVQTLRGEGFVVVERSIFHNGQPVTDNDPRPIEEGVNMFVRKGDIVWGIRVNDAQLMTNSIRWDNVCHLQVGSPEEILCLEDISKAAWYPGLDERSHELLDAIDQRTGTTRNRKKTTQIETVDDIRDRVEATVEELERDLARLREVDWQDAQPDIPAETILRYEEEYSNARRKKEGMKRKWESAIEMKLTALGTDSEMQDGQLAISSIRKCRQYEQEYNSLAKEEFEAHSRLQNALHAKKMKPIHDFRKALAPIRIREVQESLSSAKETLDQIDRIGKGGQDIRSSTFMDLTEIPSDDESMM